MKWSQIYSSCPSRESHGKAMYGLALSWPGCGYKSVPRQVLSAVENDLDACMRNTVPTRGEYAVNAHVQGNKSTKRNYGSVEMREMGESVWFFLVKVCADSEGRGGACVSGIVRGLVHTHCIKKNDWSSHIVSVTTQNPSDILGTACWPAVAPWNQALIRTCRAPSAPS